MRVAYFDLGYSREQYGLQPTRYGGGAVVARYLKEDPEVDFHVFAPQEAFENVGTTERVDRCHSLPPEVCQYLRQGGLLTEVFPAARLFDILLHPHTCETINRGALQRPLAHFCGFQGDAGHPGNDYILLYDPSFRAQFGERAKYVRIGKPVPETWPGYEGRERMVFQCSRHDDHLGGIPLAERCLREGFKGVFAGPIHNGYPLLEHIDNKTTFYLGEIDEATKLGYCRRAGLFGLLQSWDKLPFNQSIIEAQGQGTPIYTYPKGPFLSTYLKDRYNGFDASECSLTQAWTAADADVSYASWKSARGYDTSVMCATFKQAFNEIVAEWRVSHP